MPELLTSTPTAATQIGKSGHATAWLLLDDALHRLRHIAAALARSARPRYGVLVRSSGLRRYAGATSAGELGADSSRGREKVGSRGGAPGRSGTACDPFRRSGALFIVTESYRYTRRFSSVRPSVDGTYRITYACYGGPEDDEYDSH